MLHGSAGSNRPAALDRALAALLGSYTGIEAAAVVSYDGLPIASALPVQMDESRVAAMSAALLSLGERATEGLGRGLLTEVYIGGADGTVCLVSCGDEAVLVAVAEKSAKTGLVLHEIRHCAARVAAVLAREEAEEAEEVTAVPVVPVPLAVAAVAVVPSARTAPWSSYAPVGTVVPGEPVARS